MLAAVLLALLVAQPPGPPAPPPGPPAPPPGPPPPVVVEIPPPPSPWVEIAVPVATRVKLLTSDGKPATWVLIDDSASLDEIAGAAHFFAPAEARYKVVAYQPDRGFTRMVLVAGKPPQPGPDPKPPGPPGPPAPPNPADPVVASLRAALDASTEADKAESAKDLVAVFRVATRFARDNSVTTTSDLIDRVGKTVGLMVGPDKLKGVRALIVADLEDKIPDTGMELTQEVRDKAVARFQLYITALGQ